MSLFLPESSSQPQSGVASITPANPETTADDIALMQRVLSAASRNPNLIPADFMAYLIDYVQTSRLSIPIGQVFGFSGFTFQQVAVVETPESTASAAAYVDLTTPGPTLDGLPDGNYFIIYKAAALNNGAGQLSVLSPSINGAVPADADQAVASGTSYMTAASFTVARLANAGSNSIKLQYKVGAGTGTFINRHLTAVKYANL